jgi:peptide/nickel transport system substrate-binding protein
MDLRASRARRLVPVGIIAAFAAALSAASCRSTSAADPSVSLRIGVGVGGIARGGSVRVLREWLYAEPLVGTDSRGRPVASLAERWVPEDGGKALRFYLRRGVRFHDGSALTAETVRRSLQDQIAQRGTELGFAHIVEISAPADDQVLVRLSQPDNFLVSALSGVRLTHPDASQIGTGPFVLTRAEPIVEAKRFDHYYQGPSALGGVTVRPYDTQRSAWAGLMRGEIDAVQEVNRDMVEFIEGNSKVRSFASLQPFYVAMVVNQKHPAFRHVEVRRALSEAVDRAAVIDRAMNGLGQPATAPIWPQHWAYSSAITPTHDPAAAKVRLENAGFPLREGQGAGGRSRFSFRCLVWSEDSMYERIAMLVQRQLFEIGVDMQIQLVTLETLSRERWPQGDYDAFLFRFNASRSLELTYSAWRSDPATGRSAWNNGYAGADAAFDRLRLSASDDEMRAAVQELALRFHQDVPAIFIAWLNVTRAVTNGFSIGDTQTEDPFAHIWKWRPVGS